MEMCCVGIETGSCQQQQQSAEEEEEEGWNEVLVDVRFWHHRSWLAAVQQQSSICFSIAFFYIDQSKG